MYMSKDDIFIRTPYYMKISLLDLEQYVLPALTLITPSSPSVNLSFLQSTPLYLCLLPITVIHMLNVAVITDTPYIL